MKREIKSICDDDNDSQKTALHTRKRYPQEGYLMQNKIMLWIIQENSGRQLERRYDTTINNFIKLWIVKENSKSKYTKKLYEVKLQNKYCDTINNINTAKDNLNQGYVELYLKNYKKALSCFSITLNLLSSYDNNFDPLYKQATSGKQEALYHLNTLNNTLNFYKTSIDKYINEDRLFVKMESHPDYSRECSMYFSKQSNKVLRALAQIEEYEKAMKYYSYIQQQEPSYVNLDTLFLIGNINLKMGEFKESKECFDKLLKHKPNDIEAKIGIGSALLLQHKETKAKKALWYDSDLADRAIKYFRDVLESHPSNIKASLGIAMAYNFKNNNQKENSFATKAFKSIMIVKNSGNIVKLQWVLEYIKQPLYMNSTNKAKIELLATFLSNSIKEISIKKLQDGKKKEQELVLYTNSTDTSENQNTEASEMLPAGSIFLEDV